MEDAAEGGGREGEATQAVQTREGGYPGPGRILRRLSRLQFPSLPISRARGINRVFEDSRKLEKAVGMRFYAVYGSGNFSSPVLPPLPPCQELEVSLERRRTVDGLD